MGREDKKEPFLVNLGRATMRGLRKCQKCGTMNGTRGYSCKNKSCDVIFKEAGFKKKVSSEPCKIITGSNSQIYSVRVRDKGPDYRGFVQLPSENGNILLGQRFMGPDLMLDSGAKCYVDSCVKAFRFNDPIKTPVCSHIRSATLCIKEAQPLTLKNSILNVLPIDQNYKEEMYHLATDTPGPLVQRVSKNLVVVKCKPDSIHPLGFLHFTCTLNKGKKEGELKFHCSCRHFKFQCQSKESSFRKCVHLYACIVAFASDEKLTNEFAPYLDLIQNKESLPVKILSKEDHDDQTNVLLDSDDDELSSSVHEIDSTAKALEEVNERSFLILNDSETGAPCQIEVEVVKEDSSILELPLRASQNFTTEEDIESKLEIQLHTEDGLHVRTSDGGTISVHQLPENISLSRLKRKQDDQIVQASSALLTLQKSNTTKKVNGRSNSGVKQSPQKKLLGNTMLSFTSWLASVTERINQSMHYGFSGKPEALVFHLPKTFFDHFIDRVNRNTGIKKRKLITEFQKFVRKEAVPLGEFTKYTWKLYSLQQVQEVFDNAKLPLEVDRYFTGQKDGTYKLCPVPSNIEDSTIAGQNTRPHEYKTRLKVGVQCSLFPKDEVPFIIEWIPDILPITQIGELRLKFEFDHYCDKQLQTTKPFILAPVSVPKSILKTVRASGPPPLAPRPTQNKITLPLQGSENFLSIPISAESLSSGDSITLLTF